MCLLAILPWVRYEKHEAFRSAVDCFALENPAFNPLNKKKPLEPPSIVPMVKKKVLCPQGKKLLGRSVQKLKFSKFESLKLRMRKLGVGSNLALGRAVKEISGPFCWVWAGSKTFWFSCGPISAKT
jgi:hypothetical protein